MNAPFVTHVLFIPERCDDGEYAEQVFDVLDDVDYDDDGRYTQGRDNLMGPLVLRMYQDPDSDILVVADDRPHGLLGIRLDSLEDGIVVTELPASVANPCPPHPPGYWADDYYPDGEL